jgi:hypothetical protein
MIKPADIISSIVLVRQWAVLKKQAKLQFPIRLKTRVYPVNFKTLHWSLAYDSSTLEQTDKQRDHRVDERDIL